MYQMSERGASRCDWKWGVGWVKRLRAGPPPLEIQQLERADWEVAGTRNWWDENRGTKMVGQREDA